MLAGCYEHLTFHHHHVGGAGAADVEDGEAGTHGGGRSGTTGGARSTDHGGGGEGGTPIAEAGAAAETSGCSARYRCEGNVLERCIGAGQWMVETECEPPNAVCNPRAGACLKFALSGGFVAVSAPAAIGGVRVLDGQLHLAPQTCNEAKTWCVRGGFLP
jgi:hypothetical protein